MGGQAAAFGFAVMAVGIAVTAGAQLIPVGFSYDAVGPGLFPTLIGAGLIVSALAILVDAAGRAPEGESNASPLDLLPVAMISAALLLEAALIGQLGWIPLTGILFLAGSRAFGDRRTWANLAIGLVFGALVLIAFNFGLGLNLPLGPLESLLQQYL